VAKHDFYKLTLKYYLALLISLLKRTETPNHFLEIYIRGHVCILYKPILIHRNPNPTVNIITE